MFDTCIIIHLMQSSSAKSNVNELRRKLRVKGKRKREISHSKVHISKKADRHRQLDRQTQTQADRQIDRQTDRQTVGG